jgi:hypothetical protein
LSKETISKCASVQAAAHSASRSNESWRHLSRAERRSVGLKPNVGAGKRTHPRSAVRPRPDVALDGRSYDGTGHRRAGCRRDDKCSSSEFSGGIRGSGFESCRARHYSGCPARAQRSRLSREAQCALSRTLRHLRPTRSVKSCCLPGREYCLGAFAHDGQWALNRLAFPARMGSACRTLSAPAWRQLGRKWSDWR